MFDNIIKIIWLVKTAIKSVIIKQILNMRTKIGKRNFILFNYYSLIKLDFNSKKRQKFYSFKGKHTSLDEMINLFYDFFHFHINE